VVADPKSNRSREIAREVLLEAVGASATPFVPIPFVDDMLLSRVLRRVAKKVLARHGIAPDPLAKQIVNAYVEAGSPSTAESVVTGAVRFVVRKVAVVMDVKKSHDVFGESIALALALDLAAENGAVKPENAVYLGGALYRALQRIGSGPIEGLIRAGRDAWSKGPSEDKSEGRMAQLAEAIGAEVDKTRDLIDSALRYEWKGGPSSASPSGR
jgi:hypothetical protein